MPRISKNNLKLLKIIYEYFEILPKSFKFFSNNVDFNLFDTAKVVIINEDEQKPFVIDSLIGARTEQTSCFKYVKQKLNEKTINIFECSEVSIYTKKTLQNKPYIYIYIFIHYLRVFQTYFSLKEI